MTDRHTIAIPAAPPINAPAPMMDQARANCADRLRARGEAAEAELFATGQRDWAWAMVHEVNKLKAEQGAQP